jgi:hypothetical protein
MTFADRPSSARTRAARGGADRCDRWAHDASERVREATELLTQAVDLAGWFQAYEGVVESLRRNLDAALKWNDDKAKLLFSRHSPLNRERRPPD